jgi:hypothetical protein
MRATTQPPGPAVTPAPVLLAEPGSTGAVTWAPGRGRCA